MEYQQIDKINYEISQLNMIKSMLDDNMIISKQEFTRLTGIRLLKKDSFISDDNESLLYSLKSGLNVEVKNNKIIDIIELI